MSEKSTQIATYVSPETLARIDARCAAEGPDMKRSKLLNQFINSCLDGAPPARPQGDRPVTVNDLAALAVLILSARFRVSSTDAALSVTRAAFLSGELLRELEHACSDRGSLIPPEPEIPG